ncbi:hypothetical protein L3073_10940 [Ancylomarina sp. DW003]|nr:hypothetical protein [Ancylomarina sp. DW003]MDE5422723.1 hypothetical protein [Ancylomarina sp. DW003]
MVKSQTYDGYYFFDQRYLSMFGCGLNYIPVMLDGRNSYNGYNTFFINSSFYGCTLGIEYQHLNAYEEYFRNDELGFTLEFQITLVLIVEGMGKVYSYPPESHFSRYDFRSRQGVIYDLNQIIITPS